MPEHRLARVEVDEGSLSPTSADIDHERQVAVRDLLADNSFRPCGVDQDGPYGLLLAQLEGRLVLTVTSGDGSEIAQHPLSLSPLRRTIKDYFLLCESYYDALRGASPEKLETIDMARRGVHDEGTEILVQRLTGKVVVDHATARRLFTLVCAFAMRAGRGAR